MPLRALPGYRRREKVQSNRIHSIGSLATFWFVRRYRGGLGKWFWENISHTCASLFVRFAGEFTSEVEHTSSPACHAQVGQLGWELHEEKYGGGSLATALSRLKGSVWATTWDSNFEI